MIFGGPEAGPDPGPQYFFFNFTYYKILKIAPNSLNALSNCIKMYVQRIQRN
jgi:hypothetical protein